MAPVPQADRGSHSPFLPSDGVRLTSVEAKAVGEEDELEGAGQTATFEPLGVERLSKDCCRYSIRLKGQIIQSEASKLRVGGRVEVITAPLSSRRVSSPAALPSKHDTSATVAADGPPPLFPASVEPVPATSKPNVTPWKLSPFTG